MYYFLVSWPSFILDLLLSFLKKKPLLHSAQQSPQLFRCTEREEFASREKQVYIFFGGEKVLPLSKSKAFILKLKSPFFSLFLTQTVAAWYRLVKCWVCLSRCIVVCARFVFFFFPTKWQVSTRRRDYFKRRPWVCKFYLMALKWIIDADSWVLKFAEGSYLLRDGKLKKSCLQTCWNLNLSFTNVTWNLHRAWFKNRFIARNNCINKCQ